MHAIARQKIEPKGVDLAQALPGVTHAGYTKVRWDPVKVAPQGLGPRSPGHMFKLSDADRERIRGGAADIVTKELVAALHQGEAYLIVDKPGSDVLGVAINVVNLVVTAPDTMSAGRSRSDVASAGEMTLGAEVRDSQTRQVLAHVVDRTELRSAGRWSVADRFNNSEEARKVASGRARTLRNGLDQAHSIGAK